jgi:hypothetical protein
MNSNKELHTDSGSTYKSFLIWFPNTKFSYNPFTSIRVATCTRPRDVNRKTSHVFTQWFQTRLFEIHIEGRTFTDNNANPLFWRVLLTYLHNFVPHTSVISHSRSALTHDNSYGQPYTANQVLHNTLGLQSFQIVRLPKGPNIPYCSSLFKEIFK